jgi:hypothetical protein
MIRVTAKSDSFRRAGLAFGREPRTFQAGELTDEQLAILRDEPALVVDEVEDAGESGAGEGSKAGRGGKKK